MGLEHSLAKYLVGPDHFLAAWTNSQSRAGHPGRLVDDPAQPVGPFPIGLVAVSVQAALFYQSHFPADAALQIFYFITFAWGWRHWVRDKGAAPELPVTVLSSRGFVSDDRIRGGSR